MKSVKRTGLCIIMSFVMFACGCNAFGDIKRDAWREAISYMSYLQSPSSDFSSEYKIEFDETYNPDNVEKLSEKDTYKCTVNAVLDGTNVYYIVTVHKKNNGDWEGVDVDVKYR